MLHSRRIRKIIFGSNPLSEGLVFVVYNSFKHEGDKYVVVNIEEDAQYFHDYGELRYNVYIKKAGKNEEEFVWKSTVRVPVTMEYFLPNQQEDVITVT